MSEQGALFRRFLGTLPDVAGELLLPMASGSGVLRSRSVRQLAQLLGMSAPELSITLLELAQSYARPSVSDFRVGAIAHGRPDESGWPTFYLGGNVEFRGETLDLTIHAEQAATLNAWLHGEHGLHSITVSSPPCGYCRQFLTELGDASDLRVIVPGSEGEPDDLTLGDLLPLAFGPSELGLDAAFMTTQSVRLDDAGLPTDPVTEAAHSAAERSYAPYTGAHAGCGIGVADGRVFQGRYSENAAFTPSVSAFRCAVVAMVIGAPAMLPNMVRRVVLVEAEGPTSQRRQTERLAQSLFPAAVFQYYQSAPPG